MNLACAPCPGDGLCDDADVCTIDSCNLNLGECVHSPNLGDPTCGP